MSANSKVEQLFKAVAEGDARKVVLLLKRGVDVNASKSEDTRKPDIRVKICIWQLTKIVHMGSEPHLLT